MASSMRDRAFGRAVLVAAVTPLIACSTAGFNRTRLEELRGRAAFELECDAADLSFMALSEGPRGIVMTYGVEGCGQRAVYVLTSPDDLGQWRADTAGSGGSTERGTR